jgi:hypothetical protein
MEEGNIVDPNRDLQVMLQEATIPQNGIADGQTEGPTASLLVNVRYPFH